MKSLSQDISLLSQNFNYVRNFKDCIKKLPFDFHRNICLLKNKSVVKICRSKF